MSRIKDKKIEVREIVYSQDDEKSFGDVFVYEPENIEEQTLGNLFIVGELKDLPRNCSYIMNVLASKIKKEFYTNTKRTAEESLEAGLSEANKTLADLAEQGNGEYVGKLGMVCGTYHGNKFYLSQIGKIKSLLIRDGQIVEIVKEDSSKQISAKRVFNNIASGELSDGDLVIFGTSGLFNIFSLEKLRQMGSSMRLDDFSVKLQEEIEEEDSETVSALLIEIEGEKKDIINHSEIIVEKEEKKEPVEKSLEKALTEGVDIEEIIPEGSKLVPIEAAIADMDEEDAEETDMDEQEEKTGIETKEKNPKIEEVSVEEAPLPDSREGNKMLEQRNKDLEAAEALMQFKEEKPTISNKTAASIVSKSEVAAVTTESAGSSMAKDPGKVSLSDIIREYEKMENKAIEQQNADKDKSIEEMVAKKETNNFEDLDEKEESLPQKISSSVKNSLQSIKVGELKTTAVAKIKPLFQGKEKEYTVKDPNKKMSLFNKKMVIGVLLIFLVGGTYYYGLVKAKNEKAAKVATYQALLNESKSKMDQAEVESISGSEGSAGKLFLEARTLASRVKDEYDAFDSQADEIIVSAQTEIDKIDRVVRVDNAEVVASFDNDSINNLAGIDGNYYVADGAGNAIYKVDTQSAALGQYVATDNKIGKITLTGIFQNQEILLSDGSGFLSFNTKNSQFQKMNTSLDFGVQDFAIYGRYLYLLSPSDNQIYKYQKTTQGLDGKTEWLKGGDVKNAISLAIDQYVYVLTNDGQVKKYYTGEEYKDKDGNKFALKQPSDALTAPTKIYTLTDQKYLYITEPSKGRIILFDKATGSLYKQYVGSDFTDLRGLAVDADENNMLVLVKNEIVKINLAK